MKAPPPIPVLDRLVGPLADCLTPEAARRVLALKADPAVQGRVDELAERNAAGSLSAAERTEYRNYVAYGTFVAILKSRARQRLAAAPGG